MKPLVSVVSPCYNGEEYVGRMLDSILAQTYTNIEMICVDDGSTDKTAEIISSYSAKFAEKNMSLILIRQNNQGQASAINNALKLVNGDYLCWIDCDDFLTPDSVKIKLNALEQNCEYGICSSDIFIVGENDITKVSALTSDAIGHLIFQSNQFFLLLFGLSPVSCQAHMIRMSYFDRINPKREIDCCRYGQNFQILLPMYYNYPRIYINKPLGYYVFRQSSHFHSSRTKEQEIDRLISIKNMLSETLKRINIPAKEAERLVEMSSFSVDLNRIRNS
jgi:glycosyltransferase involved in cell wall biosynthesis